MAHSAHAPRPVGRARRDDRLADAALAVSVTLVISLLVATDRGAIGPLEGIVCAAVFGGLLLWRRRFPVSVLVLTILLIFGYYAAGFPPIGMVLPAVGALYSAAELRQVGWGIGCAAGLIAVSTFFRLDDADPRAALSGYSFVTEVALAAAALALGAAVRLTREARERTARIAELTAAEEALAADARMQAERLRIARDLHDTIGHTLSVASLHAAVASEAPSADGTRSALAEVRTATSEALRELRRTVKVLRAEPSAAPAPALGLASLGPVLEAARAAGITVEAQIDVPADALSRPVDAAAYRIVQESVTNVLRHARAAHLQVQARMHEGTLTVRIVDDGAAGRRGPASQDPSGPTDLSVTDLPATDVPATDPSGRRRPTGAGLRGMRERTELLGGSLSAGPSAVGFVVEARLPVRPEEDS